MEQHRNTDEKRQLFAELDTLKQQIRDLKNSLNTLNKEKESWFEKKSQLSGSIKNNLTLLKDAREKRDALTNEVKALKAQREGANKTIKDDIATFKSLAVEKKKRIDKSNKKGPGQLKQEIAHLETRLETDVMSFEKEKELTKQVKLLKKELGEHQEIDQFFDASKKVNVHIKEAKHHSEDIHKQIQSKAAESQRLHEALITASKELDALKPRLKEAIAKCDDFKKQFKDANDQLKTKLKDMFELREKLGHFSLADEERKRMSDAQLLAQKGQEVEEKIKQRKKLTTEDLLLFQAKKHKD